MTKFRKRAISVLTLLVTLLIGVCAFTACGSKDYSVTFMVDGKQYEQASVEDGSVTMPKDPVKEYYVFRNWYTTADFKEGTEFKNSGIKENLTVYARFVAKEVTVHYGIESEVKALKDLNEVQAEYENKAAENNLTFDGWYTNPGYTVKYTAGADATDLYAREMAKVTYYNGFQNVYEVLVTPGEKAAEPAKDDVQKFYMADDYFFCDYANGKVVTGADGYPVLHDFDTEVSENSTVYVMWATPGLKYELNEKSNNYYVSGFDTARINSFTAGSFSSYITVENVVRKVDVVNVGQYFMQYLPEAEKLIVNEGVKGVIDLGGALNLKVKELSLPSSLKVIENSFNSFAKLESVELPEGLEVLIDSFWSEYCSFVVNSYRETKYDFDIEIPASVTDMATVPANLKFAEGSAFGKDADGIIYKTENGKKIYIDGRTACYSDGALVIPEGFDGVQVGATKGLTLDYLTLPSTWSFVSYNNDRNDYDWYNVSAGSSSLSDKLATDKTTLSTSAIAIFDGLEDVQTVAVKQSSFPENVGEYAVMGVVNKIYRNYDYSGYEGKIVFVGQIAEGEAVSIKISAINRMTGEKVTATINDVVSGGSITAEQVDTALGLKSLSYKTVVESYTQFGEDFDFDQVIDRNLYIDVVFSFDALGFTYEENNGELTVTGFDKDTAQYLESSNTYLVAIPSELNGKAITSIKAGAFKGVNNVSAVYIPATVKEIGDEAFMNATNLSDVNIVKGGLEIVGRSAFENSGIETIALPLENLKEIRPYAFKAPKLKEFVAVAGEEDRVILTYNFGSDEDKVYPGLASGQFFFANNNDEGINHGIVKFVEKKVEKQLKDTTTKEQIDVDVYDVQYVATAGAFENRYFTVGWSYRKNLAFGCKSVIRYEMMEGSVYYLNNIETGITFGVVSKVHKNAFTDIAEKISEIKVNSAGKEYSHIFYYIIEAETYNMYNNYDKWLTPEQINSIGSKDYDFTASDALFEDGWYNGFSVNDADYETEMKFMSLASLNDSILGM